MTNSNKKFQQKRFSTTGSTKTVCIIAELSLILAEKCYKHDTECNTSIVSQIFRLSDESTMGTCSIQYENTIAP